MEGLPCGRVDQRLDQVQDLGDRAREAVSDQQRLGAGLAGSDVQEVDGLAVDLSGELRVGVEPHLGGAPVVARVPVPREFGQVPQRYAAGPPHAGQLAGPAGVAEPVMQVVDLGLRDLDAEGPDAVVAHAPLLLNGAGAPNQVVRAWRSPSLPGASEGVAQAAYPSGRISKAPAGGAVQRAVMMSTLSFQPCPFPASEPSSVGSRSAPRAACSSSPTLGAPASSGAGAKSGAH